MLSHTRMISAALLLLCTTASHATIYNYVLDQSNRLEDGMDYLSVTLSDETAGQLDFWIEPLPALQELAGEDFGLYAFSFNLGPDVMPGRGKGHGYGHDMDGHDDKHAYGNDDHHKGVPEYADRA
ncbi:MAG: hypothetical protein R3308_06830, partial [Thiohalobacterales bacterium]|nr:hypothetical protein [Thiohalobacterales bacterium]